VGPGLITSKRTGTAAGVRARNHMGRVQGKHPPGLSEAAPRIGKRDKAHMKMLVTRQRASAANKDERERQQNIATKPAPALRRAATHRRASTDVDPKIACFDPAKLRGCLAAHRSGARDRAAADLTYENSWRSWGTEQECHATSMKSAFLRLSAEDAPHMAPPLFPGQLAIRRMGQAVAYPRAPATAQRIMPVDHWRPVFPRGELASP
jgi:hypothetical protein